MKLEATDEELQSLLELKYLKPNGLGNKTSYLIEIVNIYNEKQEVVLNVEKSAESAVPSNQVSLFEKIED